MPDKLRSVNTFIVTFISVVAQKDVSYVCGFALWLVLTNFCCPEAKTICLASFLARKKRPFARWIKITMTKKS
jgi:hypothetical protein